MSKLLNGLLSAVIATALVTAPVMASSTSPSAPLGVIVQADRAQVGADIINGGATVYDGDRLTTGSDGALRVRLGGPQMYLRANTSAQVHALANGFSADLSTGSVVLSAMQGQTFQLMANGALIRPAGSGATVAQVTKVNESQLLLTSTRGPLEISMGDEVKTIDAGTSYRMEISSADTADPATPPRRRGGGPLFTARNHFVLIAIVLIGVAAGVGIWRAIFYLPNLLMPAAVASLFFSLFSLYGPVNQLLVRANLIPG